MESLQSRNLSTRHIKLFQILMYGSLVGMLIGYLFLLKIFDFLHNSGNFLLVYSTIILLYGIFAYTLYKLKSINLILVIVIFVIAVSILLVTTTNMSLDMYRYYWDGWLLKSGINPYLVVPNDPTLATFRESNLFKHMEPSYNNVLTVYPPLAQFIFALAHTFYQLLGFWGAKLIMGLPVVLLGIYFYKHLDKWLFVLFLLNPLLLFESFNGAHVDAWGMLFLAFCIHYFFKKKYSYSAFFLAFAVLTKIIPIIFFPIIAIEILRIKKIKQLFKFSVLFTGTIVAFYLPFISHSLLPILRYLSWVKDNEFNASAYRYLHENILVYLSDDTKEMARRICGIGFIASLLYLLKYRFSIIILIGLLIAFLVFSPAVYPWYTLYFIPLVFLQVQKAKKYKVLFMLIVMQFLISLTYYEWVRGYSPIGKSIMYGIMNIEYLTLFIFMLFYSGFLKKIMLKCLYKYKGRFS